ncbi:hypothetical protein GCM10020331_097440 [Ectobacillus funiculus]
MEIRHLITFRTIVDVGSYTNAAIKLGYTQSTITSHIQALEKGDWRRIIHLRQARVKN